MGTPLQIIFNKFLNLIDDIELSLLSEQDINEMLVEYLENATVEFYECSKDLTMVKPTYENYKLENVRLGSTFSIPTTLDNNSFIYLKGSEGTLESTDYNIKTNTEEEGLEITFNMGMEDNIEVLIIRDGYIVSDLSLDEVYILSLCMVLSWLSPKILREENLKQTTTDRDFKQLSNANMLNRLMGLSKMARNDLQRYRQNYSYKDFKGYD